MRTFLYLILSFILFSCQDSNTSNEHYNPNEFVVYDTIPQLAEPVIQTKYYFMVFIAEQPTELYTSYTGEKRILRSQVRHTTDIQEATVEVDEDFKYRELDSAERELRNTALKGATAKFHMHVTTYSIEGANIESNINSRDIFIYDSYAEASKARQEIMKKHVE